MSVTAHQLLGEGVHPATGRLISYTACVVLEGGAHVAAPRDVAGVAWVPQGELLRYVSQGIYAPV